METLPERGSLAALPLPNLLLDLYRRRFSGGLALSREGVEKRVWLRDGVPVLADSNLPSESLGIQLLDAGRITRDDYARVVETVRARRCKEGAALLGLELVAPQELFAALKEQVRRRLLDCFGWPRGDFALDASASPGPDATAFRCDPVPLAQEGLAIHWGCARIRAALEPQLGRYPAPSPRLAGLAARLHRDTEVEQLVAALDGASTLGEALASVRLPSSLAAAWVLDAAGAVTWRDHPVERAAGDASGDERQSAGPQFEIVVGGGQAAAPERRPAPKTRPPDAPRTRPSRGNEALRARILELHAKLASVDHYEILGVERGANHDAVKRAYFAAAKRFHPDALGQLGLADLRERANAVFARLAQAHETLSDPVRRRDYDEGLRGAQDLEVSRVVQAEALYRKAEVMLRAGNFTAALEFLAPCVQLWPEECAYQSGLGWALYKRTPSDPKTARTHLERAVALDPKDAVAHFRLGLVLRALGDNAAADRERDLARRLDPKVR
jgi:tetratricopeptide (TPR) repeat protein